LNVRESYEASVLDERRILSFAARVAGERGPFPGGYVALDSRTWTIKTRTGLRFEEAEERLEYRLYDDGALRVYSYWWTDVSLRGPRIDVWEEGRGSETRPFGVDGYFLFDHERHYRSGDISGDKFPGRRILYYAKGVGISKALKKVREG